MLGFGYLGVCVGLDALTYVEPLLKLGITPWNPDAGVTLGFLLLAGWRKAPWTGAAALLAELFVHTARAPLIASIGAALVIALGYAGLALAISSAEIDLSRGSLRAAIKFVLYVVLAVFVVASGYAATYVAAGVLPVSSAGAAIGRNWVGDMNGIFTVTPLLLAASRVTAIAAKVRRRLPLLGGQGIFLAVSMWLAFQTRPLSDLPLIYILFAPVLWITLVWGVVGASAATSVIQIGLMAGVAPLLDAGALIAVQYFLLTLGITSFLLGAVVAARADALESIAANEAEQRALLAAAPDAVLAINRDGGISSGNQAAQRLFGISDSVMLGSSIERWLPGLGLSGSDDRRRLTATRASGETVPVEVACVRLQPPAREGYLVLARDTTEQDLAQNQLRERDAALSRALRFALAGELATAVTHELRQPITALVSYLEAAELLVESVPAHDSRFVETLRKASGEALRASDILKRLREFYRGGAAEIAPVDIRALLAESISAFADGVARLGVEIKSDLRVAAHIAIDRIQFQMVLHNLLTNALDAVAEAEPGNRKIDVLVAMSANRLRMVVADSGRGVPAEIVGRLFEPFITSKLNGMGLGLAISRSLLRSQGGELQLMESTAGGARFMVELPLDFATRQRA